MVRTDLNRTLDGGEEKRGLFAKAYYNFKASSVFLVKGNGRHQSGLYKELKVRVQSNLDVSKGLKMEPVV